MTDLGFEPDRCEAWLTTPTGAKAPDDNPALQRSAEVVMEAMMAVGNDDPHLQLAILTKVKAMILAKLVRDTPAAEHQEALYQAGPAAIDETLKFLQHLRRDMRRRG